MQYLGTIDKAKDIINKDFVEKLLGDYQPLINESSKLPYSLISGVPTSLPASDVYPWAKEENKPSYSYSEITGAISTTELQNYLTSNSYLNVTSGDNRYLKLSGGTINSTFGGLEIKRNKAYASAIKYSNTSGVLGYIGFNDDFNPMLWNKSKGELGVILHSGNYSNYALPLSGGTLDGVLTIRASNSSSDSWIEFSNKSNSVVHKLGVRRPESSYGLQYYDGSEYYKIWHEGNDGSGSTLDADLLDGLHNGELTALVLSNYSGTWNYSLGNAGLSVFSDWNNTQSLSGYFYGISIESIDNRFRTVLATPLWIDGLHWRQYSDGGWQEDWRCLIDSYNIGSYNAGSATKLQTARTIWGQSFDGTGNVDGLLSINGIGVLYSNGTTTCYIGSDSIPNTYISGGNINLRYGTNIGLILNSSGNVGIGTTSPTKKLHIYDSNINNNSILLLEKGNAYDSRLDLINSVDSLSIMQHSTGNAFISLRGNHSLIFETSNSARVTIDSSGSVGIGTQNPSKKLHIYSDSSSHDSLVLLEKGGAYDVRFELANSIDALRVIQQASGNAFISLNGNHSLNLETSNTVRFTIDGSGNVGIGTTSPAQKLHVNGHIWSDGDIGAQSKIIAYGNIIAKGNIGVGTESPAYKLDVNGDIATSQYLRVKAWSGYGSGICSMWYNGNTTQLILDSGASFGYNLDVNGTISVSSSEAISLKLNSSKIDWGFAYNSIGIYHSNSQKGGFGWNSESASLSNVGFYFKNYVSGDCISLTNEGGIYLIGNVLASGGITMYSDQRKKTILNHVELSLKQIADAPLIEHYYNGDDKKTTHVGSIAQYWANMNDWFCKLDSEGFYTMEIQNAALASAISIARELDRYETKTDKAIKKLKQRICELEEEVERLKAS